MESGRELIEITNRILIIQDQKVMLDRDLAELYGGDFMFQLDSSDLDTLWSQNVTIHDLTA